MRQAMRLLLVGTAIVGARGRVTPGLCFELRLSTGGRYAINLGHQLEGIGPLLAAGVRQQPAAIVSTLAPPMSYWHGAFRAVRRNPTTRAVCVALDQSVHEGKGKCKPGKGIFCNARNCWAKKECALCEP